MAKILQTVLVDDDIFDELCSYPDHRVKFVGESCEDCISREAVIAQKIYTETEEGWTGYTVSEDIIRDLPSVQPKLTECDDCISREMVKVSLAFDSRTDDMLAVKMRKIFEIIDALPSVRPKQKIIINGDMSANNTQEMLMMQAVQPKQSTGRWEKINEEMYRCSECGESSCCQGNFCPDCGAKMEVDHDS